MPPIEPTGNTSPSTAAAVVDLRTLPPPEPMLAILEAIEGPLPANGCWAFMLPHFPGPLIPQLRQHGLDYRTAPADDGQGILLRITPDFGDD